jgi:predicted GIY-YIG superfamily endonuclease
LGFTGRSTQRVPFLAKVSRVGDSRSVSGPFFVYIVRCSDNSLYVGHARDVTARVTLHNDGRGALWTANRRPVHLVYQEPQPTEQAAVARERQIKRWTHAKKLALVDGDRAALKSLAKRRVF